MKIGKDEIEGVGILGLILIPLGVFILFAVSLLVGIALTVVGSLMYYSDLMSHRKAREKRNLKLTS